MKSLLIVLMICSSTAFSARRALKKKVEAPSPWYASADVTYSNLVRDRLEGGGESRVLGLQLGLNLPQNTSMFLRVSAMPEPIGLLDTRLGLSKTLPWTDSLRNFLSATFSVPTSDYSRSARQITQASLASTLQYDYGSATLSWTLYGSKAYYDPDPEPAVDQPLQLKPEKKPKKEKVPPPSDLFTDENLEIDYGDAIYFTRFDYLWGHALDLTWRFTPEWAVSTSGSLTRSTYSAGETSWSSEVTLLQISFSRKLFSIYASAGLLDYAPAPHWPQYKTYTAGSSVFVQ